MWIEKSPRLSKSSSLALNSLPHRLGESARKADAEAAGRGSGTRDEIPQHRRFGFGQAERREFLMHRRQFRRRDPAQPGVLRLRRPKDVVAVRRQNVRERGGLAGGNVTERQRNLHEEKSRLLLRRDIVREPAAEFSGIIFDVAIFRRARELRQRTQFQRRGIAGAQPGQFLFIQVPERRQPDFLDKKAQPREMLVFAVAIFVEHALDGFSHDKSVGRRNEFVQQTGQPALAAHAACDINRKTVQRRFACRATKPTSCTVAPEQSLLHAAKAILYLRGNWSESGSASSRSVAATAYGVTSKTSSRQTPESTQAVILRTVLPPPPFVDSPALASERKRGND